MLFFMSLTWYAYYLESVYEESHNIESHLQIGSPVILVDTLEHGAELLGIDEDDIILVENKE